VKVLILNGKIIDGTGSKPYFGNLLIKDDRIALIEKIDTALSREAVKEKIASFDADIVIDADQKAVAPGFIDIHRHLDLAAVFDPDFGRLELAQGITTALGGNCGLTPYPYTKAYGEQMMAYISPVVGSAPKGTRFSDYQSYYTALEKADPLIHTGTMLGTGSVRTAVKGYEKGPYTPEEMEKAKAYIREAMEAGAFGISMGIMYIPECYSSRRELVELAKEAAKYNRILTCHMRGEGDSLVSSTEEAIQIGREAAMPVNISHFKSVGLKNWNKAIHKAIEKIEDARAAGQEVTVDFYPYTGGATTLMSMLPPDMVKFNVKDTLDELSSQRGFDRFKKEIYQDHDGWDNMVLNIGWDRIIISSLNQPANKEYMGMSLQEIADDNGIDDPADVMRELLVSEEGKVGVIQMSMSQEDVDTIAKLPYSKIISDALYDDTDSPHPRLYGAFPKAIRDYAINRRILPLETVIRKMTKMPAETFGIKGRGEIALGSYADINIFDPQVFKDMATWKRPRQKAEGLDMTFLDGRLAWNEGRPTRAYKGGAIKVTGE
jgi:N-acyl-D-amino-acid deacylase